jgi:2-succinyl-5-enolpyruvyl-6-hydroxy-3-cyclohexene-1-carboxylate synthase
VIPSTAVARTMVDELVRHGVREVVLAPGSRSAPLALAAHAADRAGRLRLHVRVDERSAGFLALGLAKGSRLPVPVITTSGTAAANLHPAVLEASHANVPLLALTADRPAELRGTGANQTTDQVKMFGDAVRHYAEVPAFAPTEIDRATPDVRALVSRCLAHATGHLTERAGPVQVNVCFREPLLPEAGDGDEVPAGRRFGRPWTVVDPSPGAPPVTLPLGPRTVVVAGDDAGPALRMLAQHANWPLFAEPSSGARTGTHPIGTYRLLLGSSPLTGRIERVVVGGHPTLSRTVSQLLGRDDVELVVVGGSGYPDSGRRAGRVIGGVTVDGSGDTGWLEEWRAADGVARRAVDRVIAAEPGLTPHAVARAVSAAVPPHGLLFVGSSQPVRDLDLMAVHPPPGEHRMVLSNRGLAGIDGALSTAIGVALGRRSTKAIAYVGDLTFLHDSNGLVIGPDEPRPDLTIVVASDDGGSIFAVLEQGDEQHAGSFERVFGTPTKVDLGGLCRAVGVGHAVVDHIAGLRERLGTDPQGITVLEARIDRAGRRGLEHRIEAAVRDALAGV